MLYADYDYYANVYFGGGIEPDRFQRLALRGSQYLDYITQGRAEAHAELEPVKMACCALAEQYQIIEAARRLADKALAAGADGDGAELQSETVSKWSRSYRSGGDSAKAAADAAKAADAELYAIAQRYLARTGLLYRGGGRCK